PGVIKNLKPMLDGIQPITDDERRARIEKARRLMRENKLGAIFLEPGSSLYYYTGKRGGDGAFGWLLPAQGEAAWIASETGGPYRQIALVLKDRAAATGR